MSAETLQALAGALGVSVQEIRRGSTDAEEKALSEARGRVWHLHLVERGHQLTALLNSRAHLLQFDVADDVPDAARDALAELEDRLRDCGDISSEISATNARDWEKEWEAANPCPRHDAFRPGQR